MNKNAIKKFATEARRELISRVSQRALKYGISDQEVGNPNDDSVGGHLLSATEKKQRAALIAQIQEKGYEQVMEEVAYTWFNRFSALRFMEVNGYLPTRVRVFTDENNAFKPQILTEAIHMELDGLEMEKVYAYKEANDDDDLYKYLLITQCNALNSVLPGMFQKIADYTELLFPDNLLREGSVVQQMIELIPEEDWKDAVQIIGWLYQYYNSEKKDEVFAALKKNIKITKENIPAATQLFTPDWIVRYMVENSLGRLWVEGHPNDELKSQWKYYLEEAEQEPDVQAQLTSIRKEYEALTPDRLKVIDPCSGSGHILAYLFDVLMQIYESYGYTTREAVASIVENNIYGLDIDDRAAQLAYFAVMMKACQYDRRFLTRGIQPHVYAVVESNHVSPSLVAEFCQENTKLQDAMKTILAELYDAKEYGSILTVTVEDWQALYDRFRKIETFEEISLYKADILSLRPLVQVAEVLSKKYDVVVTNPPYMGNKGMNAKLTEFVQKYYKNSKLDLFAVFIERCECFSKINAFRGLITQHSWMFLQSFLALRKNVLTTQNIINMAHLGARAFDEIGGEVVQTVAFVLRNRFIADYRSTFSRLVNCDGEIEKSILYLQHQNDYIASTEQFIMLPNQVISYWIGNKFLNIFSKLPRIGDKYTTKLGMSTNDNNRFLREWYEVDLSKICFNRKNTDGNTFFEKWFPYSKGGPYRKWYGDVELVINWFDDGFEVKQLAAKLYGSYSRTCKNTQYFFGNALTWGLITPGIYSCRYLSEGCVLGDAGPVCFAGDSSYIVLAYLNSKVVAAILPIINPTINCSTGVISSLPIQNLVSNEDRTKIDGLSKINVNISRTDWDSYETSWDFARHPLERPISTMEEAYKDWKGECEARFQKLKANEEELNRIFIDIYGLQDELTPDVAEKDITVHRIYDTKEDIPESMKGSSYVRMKRDEVVSFISYSVGCMFGRYSLDKDGLAYAGGEWDAGKYVSFAADKDNIIPICDDEYFEDDIVGLFVKFVKTVYGADTLDENLKFIADALGGKGQPKDVIRNYFMNDFYKDHCKMYQKRPIYWLFDSGKKNGFKALIYMHRYQPDTIARIRTDYVHEQQARYRTAIADLEQRIADASIRERVKLDKQLKTLNDQAAEIHTYEEKIHHLADQMISIDLDDGVKKNYAIFQDVLAKIK